MPALVRRGCAASLVALSILCTSSLVLARPQVRQPQPPAAPAARQAAPQVPVIYESSQNAKQTRQELKTVLSKYSPALGRVLAVDPQLLQNAAYLEPYPELVAFLARHPEVARNASYYLSEFEPYYSEPLDRDTEMLRAWRGFFAGAVVFLCFCVVVGLLVWLVKTVSDSRRWGRLLKTQTEAHNKMLDKFSTHEELLAYISTPAGRRFLESGPVVVNGSPAFAGGPIRRILWATEVGLVLVCGGGGLFIARRNLPGDLPQMMWLVSAFVISLGIGFILSAGASYVLSRRMGILGSAVSHDQRTTDANAAE
jgi:hypothetical protein